MVFLNLWWLLFEVIVLMGLGGWGLFFSYVMLELFVDWFLWCLGSKGGVYLVWVLVFCLFFFMLLWSDGVG